MFDIAAAALTPVSVTPQVTAAVAAGTPWMTTPFLIAMGVALVSAATSIFVAFIQKTRKAPVLENAEAAEKVGLAYAQLFGEMDKQLQYYRLQASTLRGEFDNLEQKVRTFSKEYELWIEKVIKLLRDSGIGLDLPEPPKAPLRH